MTLIKKDLDKIRRDFMAKEIELDILENRFKSLECLNHSGNIELPELLMNAVEDGDEMSLARALKDRQCMRVYNAVSKGDGVTLSRVSDRNYKEFSESTFNRFYLRGICREAVDSGYDKVVFKDDSVEHVYGTSQLLSKLRSDVEFEEILGVKKTEKRSFRVEYKL